MAAIQQSRDGHWVCAAHTLPPGLACPASTAHGPQHDDSVTSKTFDLMTSITDGKEANGCPLVATMFVLSQGTGERGTGVQGCGWGACITVCPSRAHRNAWLACVPERLVGAARAALRDNMCCPTSCCSGDPVARPVCSASSWTLPACLPALVQTATWSASSTRGATRLLTTQCITSRCDKGWRMRHARLLPEQLPPMPSLGALFSQHQGSIQLSAARGPPICVALSKRAAQRHELQRDP